MTATLTASPPATTQNAVSTYEAAVVHGFGEPLTIDQVPIRALAEGQVRVEACGLCHTDIHAAHGDWPVKPAPPFVQVNEAIADVEAGRVVLEPSAVADSPAIASSGASS